MIDPVSRNGNRRQARAQRATPLLSREPLNADYEALLSHLYSFGFGPNGSLRTIGLTSSNRHEGVTTTACNLALYAANCHDLRVLLVDANHISPGLHQVFEMPQSPGLSDLLKDDAVVADCIQDMSATPWKAWPRKFKHIRRQGSRRSRFVAWRRVDLSPPQLSIIFAGSDRRVLRSSHGSENQGRLFNIGADFDLVVIDFPAVNSGSNAGFSLSSLDGLLFVIEAESTSDVAARKCLWQLREEGANVLGAVFNKTRAHLPKWLNKKLGD